MANSQQFFVKLSLSAMIQEILLIFASVHIRLHEPLWRDNRSADEIAVEILALSAQLEGICRECYSVSNALPSYYLYHKSTMQ